MITRIGAEVTDIVAPRLAQFQAMLDAAGVTRIDGMRLMEIIIAPAYFWAQLGAPLHPDRDTGRLIETALLACRRSAGGLRPRRLPELERNRAPTLLSQ